MVARRSSESSSFGKLHLLLARSAACVVLRALFRFPFGVEARVETRRRQLWRARGRLDRCHGRMIDDEFDVRRCILGSPGRMQCTCSDVHALLQARIRLGGKARELLGLTICWDFQIGNGSCENNFPSGTRLKKGESASGRKGLFRSVLRLTTFRPGWSYSFASSREGDRIRCSALRPDLAVAELRRDEQHMMGATFSRYVLSSSVRSRGHEHVEPHGRTIGDGSAVERV